MRAADAAGASFLGAVARHYLGSALVEQALQTGALLLPGRLRALLREAEEREARCKCWVVSAEEWGEGESR